MRSILFSGLQLGLVLGASSVLAQLPVRAGSLSVWVPADLSAAWGQGKGPVIVVSAAPYWTHASVVWLNTVKEWLWPLQPLAVEPVPEIHY